MLGGLATIWSSEWWPGPLGYCPPSSRILKSFVVKINDELSFRAQFAKVLASCFYHFKVLRKILLFLLEKTQNLILQGVVGSWLDYAHALYLGLPYIKH